MLRVTQKSSAGETTKYFFGYYSEQEMGKPIWLGKGSEKLNLKGEVDEKSFEAICNNRHPNDGSQITDKMVANRTSSMDFTFSVPKSISIIHGITKDDEILKSFDNAVIKTMEEIEKNSEVRVRKDGVNENRKVGNLVYSAFTHGETRPIDGVTDPQLHKHVIVQNMAYDESEDKWKAVQFRNLKADSPYYETIFRSHLAKEVKSIGYEIERSTKDFELKGFEKPLIEKFSRRTVEIEKKAEELGLVYAEDKAELGAKTRASKIKGLDRNEQKQNWFNRLSEKELNLIKTAKNGEANEKKEITAEQALEYAINHSLERKSVVSEKELLMVGLRRGFGNVEKEDMKKVISENSSLLKKTDKNGDLQITTKVALAEEKTLIQLAREGKGKFHEISPNYEIKNDKLTEEQQTAVKHVLNSKDSIIAIKGKAGVGKTYSISEVRDAAVENGMSFTAVAPSSEASRNVQKEEGFEGATTIADLLQNEKLQANLKDGVLWVDEVSLVGNRTMNELLELTKNKNTRLLLSGDSFQHNSPERGDSFRLLQKYGGIDPISINKIQRQKDDSYREAVTLISDGHIIDGFNKLDGMGAIKQSESIDEIYDSASKEYIETVKKNQKPLVVSTTHKQGKSFTDVLRAKMKDEKLLGKKERKFTIHENLNFTNAEKTDPMNYYKGLAIQFHQNVKGITRGEHFIVDEINEKGEVFMKNKSKEDSYKLPTDLGKRFSVYREKQITIAKGESIRITQNGFTKENKRLNNGNNLKVTGFDKSGNMIADTGRQKVTIDKDFKNLNYGYYNSSHSSQGKTVNKVIILQTVFSGKAASKEQFYVSSSRGRYSISIHTDDKQHLLNSVQKSSKRMAAIELKEQPSKEKSKDKASDKTRNLAIQKARKQQIAQINQSKSKGISYGK